MPQAKWRHDAVYKDKHGLDAPGYAFEYLRRNREFIRDQHRLERLLTRGQLSAQERRAFAHRWGMRFRKIRPRKAKSDSPLDDDGAAERYPTRACSSGLYPLSDASGET